MDDVASRRNIAVFWDFENCHAPSNATGFDVVASIRERLQIFGVIDCLRAYLYVQDVFPKSLNLRSELQSSGVTLIDCPHNGQKDVADKMLIGDRDYSYMVAKLRLKGHQIIVVSPQNTCHRSLIAHASLVLVWEEVIASHSSPSIAHAQHGRTPSPFRPLIPAEARDAFAQKGSPSLPAVPPWKPSGKAELSSKHPKEGYTDSTRRHRFSSSEQEYSPQYASTKPNGFMSTSKHPRSNGNWKIPDARSIDDGIPSAVKQQDTSGAASTVVSVPAPHQASMLARTHNHLKSGSVPDAPVIPVSKESAKLLPAANIIETQTKPTFPVASVSGPQPHTVQRIDAPEEPKPAVMTEQTLNEPVAASLVALGTLHTIPSLANPPESRGHMDSYKPLGRRRWSLSPSFIYERREAISNRRGVNTSESGTSSGPLSDPPSEVDGELYTDATQQSSEAITTDKSSTQAPKDDPPFPPSEPPAKKDQIAEQLVICLQSEADTGRFKALLELLAEYATKGDNRPLRSAISYNLIQRDPSLYVKAGFHKWTDYVNAAQQAGVVHLGGLGGHAWIASAKRIPSLATTPPIFAPLVRILRQHRATGRYIPDRTMIRMQVVKEEGWGFFQMHGFNDWKVYAKAACDAGVVDLIKQTGKQGPGIVLKQAWWGGGS